MEKCWASVIPIDSGSDCVCQKFYKVEYQGFTEQSLQAKDAASIKSEALSCHNTQRNCLRLRMAHVQIPNYSWIQDATVHQEVWKGSSKHQTHLQNQSSANLMRNILNQS